MESTVLGYPRIGPQRELKKATEAYWAGRETAAGLEQTAAGLRRQTWETLRDAGLPDIPSNTFSLYDHVLDTAVMVNAVPKRFAGLEGLDAYFAMARGADGDHRARADQVVRHQLPLPRARARAGNRPAAGRGQAGPGVPGGEAARHRDPAGGARPGVVPAAVQGGRARLRARSTCLTRCWSRTSSCSGSCTGRGRNGCSWTSLPWPPTAPRPSSRRSAAPTSASGRSPTVQSCW